MDSKGLQPLNDVVLACAAAKRRIESGAVSVVGCPGELGAGVVQPLCCAALSGCAGVPEPLRDLVGCGAAGEQLLECVELTEGGCVPDLVDPGASDGEQTRDVPAGVPDGVVEWRSDGPARCLEIGAVVDKCGRDVDVVAACSPVQGRLCMSWSGRGVGIGAGIDQQVHDLRAVGEVAGPVCNEVESRPGTASRVEPGRCQVRSSRDEPLDCSDVATLHGEKQLDRSGRLALNVTGVCREVAIHEPSTFHRGTSRSGCSSASLVAWEFCIATCEPNSMCAMTASRTRGSSLSATSSSAAA